MKNVVVACLLGAVTGAACLQQAMAQQSPSQSLIFADPLRQIRWISGPQKISIGDFANVNIPDGYRFTDGQGGHVILQNANAQVPNDLIGVLADNGGTWWAVLQYDKSGYIKSADLGKGDSAALLKAVQKQLKNQDNGITALTWQSAPAFDAQAHSLGWSVQVQAGSGKTLRQGVALLGRHGVLEVTSVESYPLAAAPALDQIVSQDIRFEDGERYSDYQNGDKMGSLDLAGLVAGNNGENSTTVATSGWVYWVYAGLALCLSFAGVMIFVSRKKSPRQRAVRTPVPAAAMAKAAPTVTAAAMPATATSAAPAASTVAAPVALTNAKLNGNGNGNGNGHSHSNGSNGRNGKQFHRNRRKRMFDYPKFYTHVMQELSFHAYEASGQNVNGKGRNGHMNGHANGHANGANGHAEATSGSNGSDANSPIKSGIEELIATQKALIQEQKCLLEQQTRLIEEKRWLIEEQTAFLKGQAEQFPLKFE